MRNLIQSVLAPTAVLALVIGGAACSRSSSRGASSSGVQTQTPAAERVNPGSGYYGSAPENVNRPSTTTPTGMGGGPESSGGSSMGLEQPGTGTGTDTEMTGDDQSGSTDSAGGSTSGTTGTKKKSTTKKSKSTDGSTEPTGGGEKGSGTTGGTQK